MSSIGFSVPRAALAAGVALFSASAVMVTAAPSIDPHGQVGGGAVDLPQVAETYRFVPNGMPMGFEPGLTREQQARISQILSDVLEAQVHHSEVQVARRDTCAARTACYVSTCWVPFVGIACLACDEVRCRREAELDVAQPKYSQAGTDFVSIPENMGFEPGLTREQQVAETYIFVPDGLPVGFEPGLTREQQARISQILSDVLEAQVHHSEVQVARRDTCAARTACYVSTCWVPFVGIACLACDEVRC